MNKGLLSGIIGLIMTPSVFMGSAMSGDNPKVKLTPIFMLCISSPLWLSCSLMSIYKKNPVYMLYGISGIISGGLLMEIEKSNV